MRALDFSNYQNPSRDDLQAAWDIGYRRAVAGLHLQSDGHVPDHTLTNIDDALGVGYDVQCYFTPWVGPGFLERIYYKVRETRRFPIGRYYLDIEDDGYNASRIITDEIAAMLALIPAGRRGIYASPDTWQRYTGGTTRFRHVVLWLASWVDEEVDNVVRMTEIYQRAPFGGWRIPNIVMHQWRGTTEVVPGFQADLNFVP